jgi:hypothetical protein|tara:strand:+ start:113 stop:889 length:777 start_codon:yes stop_codon:yes gene_type:complete
MRKAKKKIGRSFFKKNEELILLKRKKEYFSKVSKKVNFDNLNQTILPSSRRSLSRILYYNDIYKNILGKPGVIMEFGVEYGSTLSLLSKLRSIYEPYNYSRKIIGFDTFSGFNSKLNKDEKKLGWKKGDYKVEKNYEKYLEEFLTQDELMAPLPHIKKFELVKGDAGKTINNYLKKNNQTVIALAILDMDVYDPTKKVLQKIKNRLFKGSVLVFDQLNHPDFPGETKAVLEILGIRKFKLKSFHGETFGSYVILEDFK